MKKIIILLVVSLSVFICSCSKDDDSKVRSEKSITGHYTKPFLNTNPVIVKEHLLKIADNVVETKRKGYYKLTCTTRASKANMFSSLSYEFTTVDLDFKGLNFSYKFDEKKKLTKADKDVLVAYLKKQILK